MRPDSISRRLVRPRSFAVLPVAVPLPWPVYVLAFLFLANLPFWYTRYVTGLLPIGWICSEYLLIGVAGLYLPSLVAVVLLLATVFADVLSAVSRTYYLTPLECLLSLRAFQSMPASRLVLAFTAVLVLSMCCAIAFQLFSKAPRAAAQRRAALTLVALGMTSLLLDVGSLVQSHRTASRPFAHRTSTEQDRSSDYRSLWVGRYPLIRLWREQTSFSLSALMHGAPDHDGKPMNSAVEVALPKTLAAPTTAPDVVLILVESWGLANDPNLRALFDKPYQTSEIASRYNMKEGTVRFVGPTLGGELRELCRNNLAERVIGMDIRELTKCLPYTLQSAGYHTVAIHGMDKHLFDRVHWWQRIGFQETWFRDRLVDGGLPVCKQAFVAICDTAISQWIAQRLQQQHSSPQFLYWVTVGSHLPVLPDPAASRGLLCQSDPALARSPGFCAWFSLVFQVHDRIASVAVRELARPTIFVLVGDHAPPFIEPELHTQFSREYVPYIALIPKHRLDDSIQADPAQHR